MYTIEERTVGDIPLLEYSPAEAADQPLPLVIFYHGWTSRKESNAAICFELVKRGMRVISPDALKHGERIAPDQQPPRIEFFDTLLTSVGEYPRLIDYYEKAGLLADGQICVGGLSMGGITCAMLLAAHPEIKAAAILMGTPALTQFAEEVTLATVEAANGYAEYTEEEVQGFIDQLLASLAPYDLSLHPERLAKRPVFFWHGLEDDVVPYRFTEPFIHAVQEEDYGQNVHLSAGTEGVHQIRYYTAAQQAEFLKAALTQPADQVFPVFQQAVREVLGAGGEDRYGYQLY